MTPKPNTLALTAALALLAAAPAAAAPASFDCTKAHNAVERAICADAGLSATDVVIAQSIAGLLRRLDLVTAKFLREDQLAFLRDRNDLPPNRATLAEALQKRADFLASIDPAPRPGFAGAWAGLYGTIRVADAGGGRFKVEAATADPAGGWTCRFAGEGGVAKDALAVPGSEAAAGWTLRLARKAGALIATVEPAEGGRAGAAVPGCEAGWTLAGAFLPVK